MFIRWIGGNWQAVLGWVTGLVTLYKGGRWFAKLSISFNNAMTRFEHAESTLNALATNHLPHLQIEMEKMNDGIADLQISSDKGIEVLSDIKKDLFDILLRERD